MQNGIIKVISNCAIVIALNACVASLTSCIETAMIHAKNGFDAARAIKSIPNPNNLTQKLYHNTTEDYDKLKEKLN